MVIIDPKFVLNTEPYPVTSTLRIRSNVREDGQDELVWEFENCEIQQISARYEELILGSALMLVCGAGGPRDSDSGTVA